MADIINNENAVEASEVNVSSEIEIRRAKLENLIETGKNPFEIMKYDVTAYSTDIKANFEEFDGKTVSLAGRIMSRRDMGKANFIDVADGKGRIQCYIKIDEVGEEVFEQYKKWDIGDIVGIHGFAFRTRRGEISVHVKEYTLLSKSLLPLPDKWSGLKDVDTRYRQRYVDLIVNPESRDTFIKRSRIITEIRKFLDSKGFLEVETPVLQTIPGGASARPFITHHNTLDIDMYCRIALELPLKRLIVGGFERVYEIGRVFRNEGISVRHNPEFTLMELYQAYTDYNGMMDITEDMFRTVAQNVLGTTTVNYGGHEIRLGEKFARITMVDAVKQHTGIDFDQVKDTEEAKAIAKEKGVEFEDRHQKGDILNLFFEEFVELEIYGALTGQVFYHKLCDITETVIFRNGAKSFLICQKHENRCRREAQQLLHTIYVF